MDNHVQDAFESLVVQDVGRCNSHYPYALFTEPGISPRAMTNLSEVIVMCAVYLDGQSC
jgi:hypothetical protein